MKRKYFTLCMLLFVSIFFLGCSDNAEVAKKKTAAELAEQRKADSLALKVGTMQTIDCLPAFVAKDEGIFDSLGVDVRLYHYTSMLDYDNSLKNGKIEGVFTDAKHMEYVNGKYGLGMQQVMQYDMQWQLVANRKSRIRQARQLTDKIVAMSRCSVTDYLCDRLEDSVKLNKERVFRVQVNDVDIRLKMLLNNEIDAAWLPEPQATVAIGAGNDVLMNSGGRGERFAVLAFSSKALGDKRRKQQVELFKKAYGIALEKIDKGGKKYYDYLIEHYYKYKNK